MSPLHGDGAVGLVVRIGAFVESHDDICAEVLLDRNRLLGCEAMRGAVNVTLEGDAVVVNFAGLRKREDLKTARVGEHGPLPLHELVQAAHVAHEFVAGAQVEMIGVAQYERSIDILEMFGREGLDRCLCAHGREDGCAQVAVRGGKNARTGAMIFGCDGELEHGGNYNGRE